MIGKFAINSRDEAMPRLYKKRGSVKVIVRYLIVLPVLQQTGIFEPISDINELSVIIMEGI
ncbi:hypothetical protein KAW48_06125 [candidate division WOR-3 bacterium]|nr:hypothetical protein [candidate division WOR-3 bacterium]